MIFTIARVEFNHHGGRVHLYVLAVTQGFTSFTTLSQHNTEQAGQAQVATALW